MKTKIEYPRNGFSHHALIAKSRVTIKFAKRDAEFLAGFGINEAFISGFENKIKKLETVSTFYMDKETKFLSNSLKDNARNELYITLRNARKRFSIIFPVSSDEYKQTMNFNIYSSKASDFISFAKKMLDGLTEYSSQLSSVSITDELILNIQNQIVDFENILDNNSFVKENTDNNTEERTVLQNAVYSDFSHLCKVGKIVWEDESAARYKDYVIYKKRVKSVQETNDIYDEQESLE